MRTLLSDANEKSQKDTWYFQELLLEHLLTFPMLLQLTRKEALATALSANVLLVGMVQTEVISNFWSLDQS